MPDTSAFASLKALIDSRMARAAVIGLDYVGLPLAITLARAGYRVTGFDIDPAKIVAIEAGRSYIAAVSEAARAWMTPSARFVGSGSSETRVGLARMEPPADSMSELNQTT